MINLKKSISILSFVIFLVALFFTSQMLLFPTTVAENSQQSFYIANNNLNVYGVKKDNSPNSDIAFSIPKTYYFLTDGVSSGDFTAITYNDNKFFIKTTDLTSSATKQPSDISSPYFAMSDFQITAESFNYYYNNNLDSETLSKSKLVSSTFIGFNIIANQTYFYSKIVFLFNGENQTVFAFISPTDTNKADMDMSKVEMHPNSKPKPDPDPDDTPDKTPPVDKKTPASNNFIRNILIAVIAALSVIIVFLIFKPSHNNRNRYDHNRNDNYRND